MIFISTAGPLHRSARAFYSAFDANTQFIFALLTFSAGFLVRPLGALVFGRIGDLVGRKYTFLVTITIMGLSTFLVGLTPGYETLGWMAPVILIGLRLLQGLALGGEYGGSGDICGRTRAARSPWLLHVMDSDDGDDRSLPFAARGLHRAQQHEPGFLRGFRVCPAAGAFPICCRSSCSEFRSGFVCNWRNRRCSRR